MTTSTKSRKSKPRGRMVAMIHIPLTKEQKECLDQMSAADRRRGTEFMRILIDDEWNRRQKAAQPAPGAAA